MEEAKKYLEGVPHYSEFDLRIGKIAHPVAELAFDLIRAHPNVAGVEDGEDTTGRQKLRLQRAQELVDRSYDLAQIWYDRMLTMGSEPVPNVYELAVMRGHQQNVTAETHYGNRPNQATAATLAELRANAKEETTE